MKGNDGKVRQVVQIEMNLVSDNLSKNATLYKDLVAEFSQVFQIEQPLIFAVMEQESRFNPEATSWVPAYGLMQLVPKSGGLDAYNYVYKNTWAPTSELSFRFPAIILSWALPYLSCSHESIFLCHRPALSQALCHCQL